MLCLGRLLESVAISVEAECRVAVGGLVCESHVKKLRMARRW